MKTLRADQDTWVNALGDAFRRHRRVCGVAPTGYGKTVCFSRIARGAAEKRNRVLVMAHRGLITKQISAALHEEGVRHGRVQPAFSMTDDLVQVGMVNTVGNRLDRLAPPKLIVIDEGHHAVSPTYRKVLAAFPDAKVLTVTATPERADGKGLKDVADVLVEAPPVRWLIEQGILAGFKYMAPPILADLSKVKMRGGDYAIDELAAEMDRAVITGSAIQHYQKYMQGRAAVVFCVNVAHAEHVAAQFQAAGVRAASVDGRLSDDLVERRLSWLGNGNLQVVTSCDLISEGVDVPDLYGAFMLRPSKSRGLVRQQIGRALRRKRDGGFAWIFDHVGNHMVHGLPDSPVEWSLEGRKKKTENVVKTTTCESCYKVFVNYPGWRAEQPACEDADSTCALLPPAAGGAGGRAPPEEREGELQEVTDSPVWARGLSISDARGEDFKRLVRLARTPEQLEEVRRLRGFKHGWVGHILESRGRAH